MKLLNKNILRIAVLTALLLLIPLVAMQFSDEVQWTLFDFVFMAGLLFGTGLTYELLVRSTTDTRYKLAVALGAFTSLLLIWVNAAVGIIGDGPANLLYFGVIAVGILGMIIFGRAPQNIAKVLFAMAGTQFIVPIIAFAIWQTSISWEPGLPIVFILNAFFAILFGGIGVLFLHSAPQDNVT